MATTNYNSIDDWLGSRSGADRFGGDFLKSWKKEGSITVWLHTKRLPVGVWQHTFPQLTVFEDKDTGNPVKKFWGKKVTCWENSLTLKKQFKRNRATGEREIPPRRCPICKLLEVVRKCVSQDKLAWTDKIFVFDGATDPSDNVTLHAGGIYGAFGGDLSDDDKDDLRQHGIKQSQAWRENANAKENTVFSIVNNAHPDDGVQITTETSLLGDKVKGVINDSIADQGDEGNPVLHPYAIEWVFNDAEGIPFDKKYHARRVSRHKLTPQIRELIEGDPPDLSAVLDPFDRATMRAFFEKYAVVDLPWEKIFLDEDADAEEAHREPTRSAAKPSTKATREPEEAPRRGRRGTRVEPPKPEPTGPTIPCDECKAPMPEDASKCGACGAEYELDDDPAPAKKSGAGSPDPGDDFVSGGFDGDDEIPF